MTNVENSHNANLPNTLPKMEPIVNYKVVDSQDPDRVEYKAEYASSKLFVKIANSIFQVLLKPRILEFYFHLAFITYAYPTAELSFIKLRLIILKETKISYNKDTINKYINELIKLGLIAKVGKYYHVYGDRSNQDNNQSSFSKEVDASEAPSGSLNFSSEDKFKGDSDGGCQNTNLTKKKESNSSSKTKTNSSSNRNIYHEPKDNYTPFFITIYNEDTKAGSMALELYFASKPYNLHRPILVCKELNISRATYYKYLKDLVSKGVIAKQEVNYRINQYTNSYRQVLWNDYINIQDLNYMDKKFRYQDINRTRRLRREQEGYKTPHSRLWYASSMKRVMKQYKVNYFQAFDNYDPEDAYLIVLELEAQYKANPDNLRAGLIVDAILNSYNWTKIVDRRHAKFKREQKREKEKFGNSRYMEELFGV